MPFYDFTDGEQLTASLLETYLSRQAVMTFASSAARSAALAPVLAEGMVTYLADTDKLYSYDGSAWQVIAAWQDAMDIRTTTMTPTTSFAAVQSVTLLASSTYLLDGNVFVSGMTNGAAGTYGHALDWTVPTSATGMWQVLADGGGSGEIYNYDLSALSSAVTTTQSVDNAGTTYAIRGHIVTSSAGTLTLRIKLQNASGTGAAQAGSYLSARQVA